MQEEYHLLVDSIKDYAIFMLDTSGHVSTWNVGAQRIKGYSEQEIVGKYYSLFFLPEDRKKGKPENELKTAFADGRFEEEGWRMRKNGTKFWANVILTPIFNENKEHVGFAKVTRDLTEKRRTEELYLLLVNQVKEYAIFMIDQNGNILTWNEGAERIKGYTADEIVGRNFSTLYAPEDRDAGKPKEGLRIAKATGKYEDEGWRLKKDGTRFWASVVITPVYKDEHIGFAKVTRDLTKRKEMEQIIRANAILDASNKDLERFAYIASHDLKEPLRKITTFSDVLINDELHPLSDRQQAFLGKIQSAAIRMNTLIEDILSFSTLSEKQHFEKYSLNSILFDTMELLEQAIATSNASILYDGLPEAIVIPSQIRQVFQNIISNSIKFAKKGVAPVIRISHEFLKKEMVDASEFWPAEEYLQLSFQDNGIGFEQQHAEKIFNLFDRLHAKSAYEGTGVGLAICKKIAENHGGTISAHAQPGDGARFMLTIPA